MKTPGYKRKTS